MGTFLLFLCLSCISSAIGEEDEFPTPHLIGGTTTSIANFPFQVSMREKETNLHVCGGAIVTEKFLLTAAHCVCYIEFPITDYYIFLGSTELSGQGQNYTIEHAICHADYTTKIKLYDIGLIGVNEKIIFNQYVKPISIVTSEIPVGTTVTISGWGYTSYPNTHQPNTLQRLRVPIISMDDCKQAYKRVKKVYLADTQICTFVKVRKASTCKGDSGGPVTLNGVLVALVSWGVPCAIGKPDSNTKVSRYTCWIKTTIDSYCSNKTCPDTNLYPKFVRLEKKKSGQENSNNKKESVHKRSKKIPAKAKLNSKCSDGKKKSIKNTIKIKNITNKHTYKK